MILDNPFHVLGLPADCTRKEANRRIARTQALLRVGQPLAFDEDLYFPLCRRNRATAERAISQLQDADQRIQYGVFWFTRSGILDHHAQRLVVTGNLVKALRVLERIEWRPVTAGYASSLNNLGTICLLLALDVGTGPATLRADLLHRGLRAKARLLGLPSEQDLTDFLARLGDELAARSTERVLSDFGTSLSRFLEEAKKYGVSAETLAIVEALDTGGPRCAPLKTVLGSTARHELERAVSACAASYAQDPSKAYQAAQDLVEVAGDCLADLAASTSDTDIGYVSLADRTAEALLDAAVTNFNHRAGSGELSLQAAEESLTVVRRAAEIASSEATKKRAQDDLETITTVENDLRSAEVQRVVAADIADWLDRTRAAAETAPKEQIAFVRDALAESSDPGGSVLSLLDAARSHGAATHGATYLLSEEMVKLNSVVCHHLLNLIINAYNLSGGLFGRAKDIAGLKAVFPPVSEAGSRRGRVFPVDAECARRLDVNRKLVRHPLVLELRRVLTYVIVFVIIILISWLAEGATSHPHRLKELPPAGAGFDEPADRQPAQSAQSGEQPEDRAAIERALQQRVLELETSLRAAEERIRELEEARERSAEVRRGLETELVRERSERQRLGDRTAADARALGDRVDAIGGQLTSDVRGLRGGLADERARLENEEERRAAGDRRGIWYVTFAGVLSLLAAALVWRWSRRETRRLRNDDSRFRESVRGLLSLAGESLAHQVQVLENLAARLPEAGEPASAEPDHGLALEVCNEIQRIENNLRPMDSSVRGHRKLMRAVVRMKDNLKVREYEITDLHGAKYDPGMKVSTEHWTTDDSLQSGTMVISWVMVPEVRFRGGIIQVASVHVTEGP